jgi:hypothetical protein
MKIRNIISLATAFFLMIMLFSCKNSTDSEVPDTSDTVAATDAADTSSDTAECESGAATDASTNDVQTEPNTDETGAGSADESPNEASSGGAASGGTPSGVSSDGAGGVISGGGNSSGNSSGSTSSGSNSSGSASSGSTGSSSSSAPSGSSSSSSSANADTSKYFGIRCDTSPDYPVAGEDTSKTVESQPIKSTTKTTDPNADYNSHTVSWNSLTVGSEVNGVTIGYNGWMFYQDTMSDYVGTSVFTQARAESIVKMMKERVSYLENTLGMKVYMIIPPNKNTIYPEYMPESYTMGSYRKIDQVIDLLRNDVGMTVIDVRDALYEAKNATPQRSLYYQTDTHWNNHAGFIAYTELMNAIKKDFPNAVYHPKSDYQIDYYQTYAKDLLYYLGYYDDFKSYGPQYTLKNPCYLSFKALAYQPTGQWQFANVYKDGYADYYRFYTYTNYTNSSAPSVYMMRDSFSVAMASFMKDSFSKCTMDWTFTCYKEHIENIDADIVIFEVAERNIDSFLNTTPFRSGDPY